MLEPKQLIRFAEGGIDLESDQEEIILKQVATNGELRKQLAEIRRDLYLVDCQIPEYNLNPEYIIELNKLGQAWLKLRIDQQLRGYKFLFSREFISLALFVCSLLIFSLILLSF